MRKTNLNDFIEKSNIIHENKYDYSLVDYRNAKTKIKIICFEHGVFEQTPDNHCRKNGSGCPKCNGGVKLNKKIFIDRSNIIHQNKYDYSLIHYINNSNKVKIICPEHGIFEQTPQNHLNCYGCYKCGVKKRSVSKSKNTYFFIEKSNTIHGNKYDYSLVDYKNTKTKIKIICSEHGVFEQTPNSHLNGSGCPNCKNSKGEKKIKEILISKNIEFIQQYRFKNCKYKRSLPFDFYLPKQNICIEYDGEHHFSNKIFNDGKIKLKDGIKTKYCHDNDIKLIRIPFYDFNLISEILFFLDK